MSFTEIAIQAKFANADGSPASGSVSFSLVAEMLNSGQVAAAGSISAPLNADGQLISQSGYPQTLLATDDTGTTPNNPTSAYLVTIKLDNASGAQPFYVYVPHASTITEQHGSSIAGSPVATLSDYLVCPSMVGQPFTSSAFPSGTTVIAYDLTQNTLTLSHNATSTLVGSASFVIAGAVDLNSLGQYQEGPVLNSYIPFVAGNAVGDYLTWNGTAWISSTVAPGGVDTVTASDSSIVVDNSDPANPKISADAAIASAESYAAGLVSNEASTRANADTTLQTNINAEATARIAGDAASVSTAETFATNAVSAEATTRAAGDATNATAIAAETTRAETAEALLIPLSQKGVGSGVATLDSGGHLPSAQLPNVGPGTTPVGDASHTVTVTLDAEGRVTALTANGISIPHTDISDWASALSSALSGYFNAVGTGLTSAGSTVFLATAGAGAGSYGDAAHTLVLTLDAYGRVSGITSTTIAIAQSQVSGLVAALAALAPLASPALTGVPTAPTAAPLTNNTQLATTAYTDSAVAVETSRATSAEALRLIQRVTNASGLLPLQSARGRAQRARVDIVVMSNSVGRGVGSAGDPATFSGTGYAGSVQATGYAGVPFTSSDNYLGWAGQLRSALNYHTGTDPGEGFVFTNDARFEYDGGASATYSTGPQGVSVFLSSATQYVQLNQTIMSGGWSSNYFSPTNYVGVIFWDGNSNAMPIVKVNGATQTMTTRPGGNVALSVNGSTSKYVVGYVAAPLSGQTFAVYGPASGGAYVTGFDLVGDVNGVHVHNVSQSGFVTADLLGAQSVTSGVPSYNLTASQRDRVIRASFEWLTGGVARTVSATIATNGVYTITSGNVDQQDLGAAVSGTGVPSSTTVTQWLTSTTFIAQSPLGAPTLEASPVTVTITPQATPGLIIIAHEELNDYTQQGPCSPLRTMAGYISGGVLTLTSGTFSLTDVGNVQVAGGGITGGGGLANIGTPTSSTTAPITATGGSTVSNSGSAGSPNTYTTTPTTSRGCNTPTTSAQHIQDYLLGQNSGNGPLAEGWTCLIVGGPRRYPDGTLTPAGTAPTYSQSSFISALAALAGNIGINSLLSQVAAFDLSTIFGSTTQMVANGVQYASGSVHPTLEGHGAFAAVFAELWNELATFGAVTATVPA